MRFFKYIISVVFLLFFTTLWADYENNINSFIINIANRFTEINEIKDKDVWIKEAQTYANDILDIKWISGFILGRHKKYLNQEQTTQFTELYSEYLLNSYIDTLSQFSANNLHVVKITNQQDKAYFVRLLVKNKDQNANIDLRLVQKNDVYYITDIIAENISFINTQRADVDGYITNNGFDKMIEALKNKKLLK